MSDQRLTPASSGSEPPPSSPSSSRAARSMENRTTAPPVLLPALAEYKDDDRSDIIFIWPTSDNEFVCEACGNERYPRETIQQHRSLQSHIDKVWSLRRSLDIDCEETATKRGTRVSTLAVELARRTDGGKSSAAPGQLPSLSVPPPYVDASMQTDIPVTNSTHRAVQTHTFSCDAATQTSSVPPPPLKIDRETQVELARGIISIDATPSDEEELACLVDAWLLSPSTWQNYVAWSQRRKFRLPAEAVFMCVRTLQLARDSQSRDSTQLPANPAKERRDAMNRSADASRDLFDYMPDLSGFPKSPPASKTFKSAATGDSLVVNALQRDLDDRVNVSTSNAEEDDPRVIATSPSDVSSASGHHPSSSADSRSATPPVAPHPPPSRRRRTDHRSRITSPHRAPVSNPPNSTAARNAGSGQPSRPAKRYHSSTPTSRGVRSPPAKVARVPQAASSRAPSCARRTRYSRRPMPRLVRASAPSPPCHTPLVPGRPVPCPPSPPRASASPRRPDHSRSRGHDRSPPPRDLRGPPYQRPRVLPVRHQSGYPSHRRENSDHRERYPRSPVSVPSMRRDVPDDHPASAPLLSWTRWGHLSRPPEPSEREPRYGRYPR